MVSKLSEQWGPTLKCAVYDEDIVDALQKVSPRVMREVGSLSWSADHGKLASACESSGMVCFHLKGVAKAMQMAGATKSQAMKAEKAANQASLEFLKLAQAAKGL